MTTFGLIWVILLIAAPIIVGIYFGVKEDDEFLGIFATLLGYSITTLLAGFTIGTADPYTWEGGYDVPNYKRYYMATNRDGSVDVTKVVTYYKCSHGHLHTDVDYVFFVKLSNGGRERWTADKNLRIEYYTEKDGPKVETVESYYHTGHLGKWTRIFFDEDKYRLQEVEERVVAIYIPKGTKIKTIESNNGKRN